MGGIFGWGSEMKGLEKRLSRERVGVGLAALVFFLPYVIPAAGLSPAGQRLFSIFLVAIVLWVSEAVPLYATSALVILLSVLTLSEVSESMPWGMAAGPAGGEVVTHAGYFATLANPILLLFLGGFFLAHGAAKFGVDRNLARLMLRPFGVRPKWVLLGLMVITGFLSMWMSNTATTATLMAVVLPLIHQLGKEDRLRVALALGIPFAANIGGMGTPVGSPPNAIAIAALGSSGGVTFSEWMIFAVPFTAVMLVVTWGVLVVCFPSETKELKLEMSGKWETSGAAWIFYVTSGLTVALWVTESLHGLPSAVVGFLTVTVLLSTRVITSREFRMMEWDILWLVAGGIALGKGVQATGFDSWLVSLVGWEEIPPLFLGGVLAAAAMLLSTFISNSAAANLLAPMAVAIAVSTDSSALGLVAYLALSCSMAMSMPISTPPNAIAHASGVIRTADMAKAGILVGLLGLVVLVLLLPILLRLVN